MTGDQQPFDSNKQLTERLDIDIVLQATGLGIWELDLVTNQVLWDRRCCQLFGTERQQLAYPDTLHYIHSEDVERVKQALQWALNPQSNGNYQATYRTLGEDGRTRWIQATGRRYLDPSCMPVRLAGVAQDVTPQLEDNQQTQRQQRISEAITASSPDLMYVFDLSYRFTYANQALLAMWGRSWEASIGKDLLEIGYEPWHAQLHEREIDQVVATKQPIRGEVSFPHATLGRRYYDYVFAPVLNEQGEVEAVAGTTRDITGQIEDRQKIKQSEAKLRSIINSAPTAIGVFVGSDLIVENPNQLLIELLGQGPDLEGKSFRQILSGVVEEDQKFIQLIDTVRTSGQPFDANEVAVFFKLDRQTRYFNISFVPLLDEMGTIYAVLDVSVDVTGQVAARRNLKESEAKFRLLIDEAPFATALYKGPELTIDTVNEAMLQLWDKPASVVGKTFDQALPELEGQPFTALLKNVYQSGVEYIARGQSADIMIDGRLQRGWYNFNYKPLCNQKGEVYGILHMAIEVTQQVLARQELEDAQVHLQEAIELAQLGTWSIDVATQGLTFSDRLIEWFGYDPKAQSYDQVIPILDSDDQERINRAVAWALNPESDGVYNEIYTVIHPKTGEKRILHARGKTVFDAHGQAIRLNGTAQDITLQREMQLALEQQVQQRTEELAATNEELRATNEELAAHNEEYAVLNEELEEANSLLIRSNENLQQFAYVASHDLQEPLRKIQQFGDLLKGRYTASTGDELVYLDRMQSAAARMSILIKDLLDFSRISTQRDTSGPVSLDKVVQQVLTTLELTIQETGARINVGALPTVMGDTPQLNQLFQNLLSNALKFHRPGIAPLIELNAGLAALDQLPEHIKPGRGAVAYHRIEVTDHGIGFDEKYLDRIFQVFQRLHGKSKYVGTGIGLAICEKVVNNHGGAITATSQPGQGATFTIYLPA